MSPPTGTAWRFAALGRGFVEGPAYTAPATTGERLLALVVHLALTGPRSRAHLAERFQLQPRQLRRLLASLRAIGFHVRSVDGVVELGAPIRSAELAARVVELEDQVATLAEQLRAARAVLAARDDVPRG